MDLEFILKLSLSFVIAYGVSALISKLIIEGAKIVKLERKKKIR